MRQFSTAAQQIIHDVAQRQGFTPDAVAVMLQAVRRGHGRMAQFDHPELGGAGQWMRGGMTMVSDLFNATLKARVERLCDELSGLIAREPGVFADPAYPNAEASLFVAAPDPGGQWWPADLGPPDSAGSQNGARYAYFAAARRLAVDIGGRVTVYDTLDHRISGVAQQQSDSRSLTFSSRHGVVDLAALPIVRSADQAGNEPVASARAAAPQAGDSDRPPPQDSDIVAIIEKLAELQRKGILSAAEFAAKKTDLLSRL